MVQQSDGLTDFEKEHFINYLKRFRKAYCYRKPSCTHCHSYRTYETKANILIEGIMKDEEFCS